MWKLVPNFLSLLSTCHKSTWQSFSLPAFYLMALVTQHSLLRFHYLSICHSFSHSFSHSFFLSCLLACFLSFFLTSSLPSFFPPFLLSFFLSFFPPYLPCFLLFFVFFSCYSFHPSLALYLFLVNIHISCFSSRKKFP